MDWLAPRAAVRAPVLVELAPLPPAPRISSLMTPVAISLAAIRDAADRGAPRTFAGKADNPVSQLRKTPTIGWDQHRADPSRRPARRTYCRWRLPLTGTLNVTGSLSSKATGAVGDALAGLLGGNVAKQIGSVNIKGLNASAEIKGQCHHHRAAKARSRLAHRAQSGRAGEPR